MSNEILLSLAFLFVCKLLDIGLSTLKTIMLYKGYNFHSSVLSSIGQYFYLIMMVKLAKSSGNVAIIVICVATFIGSYLPAYVVHKREKDKMWMYMITANTSDTGMKFISDLEAHDIPVTYNTITDHDFGRTICCNAFSRTKEDSKLIEAHMPKPFKYSRLETIN